MFLRLVSEPQLIGLGLNGRAVPFGGKEVLKWVYQVREITSSSVRHGYKVSQAHRRTPFWCHAEKRRIREIFQA